MELAAIVFLDFVEVVEDVEVAADACGEPLTLVGSLCATKLAARWPDCCCLLRYDIFGQGDLLPGELLGRVEALLREDLLGHGD